MTEAQLVADHDWIARGIASGYFWGGSEPDDVLQEARLALVVAARAHRPELGPFSAFAHLVIRRKLAAILRCSKKAVRGPLDDALRQFEIEPGDVWTVEDFAVDPRPDDRPEIRAEQRERFQEVCAAVRRLTPIERSSILALAAGYSYAEIEGVENAAAAKRIDNAIQRARTKLREAA